MQLVSEENIKLKRKQRDKAIFVLTIIFICFVLIVELVNICLIYSPFNISQMTSKTKIRMGFWITDGTSSNAFYFSWLNILMIVINVVTMCICVLAYYLNYFKAHKSYANKYQYTFFFISVLWLIANTFIGEFSIINNEPVLWDSISSSGAFNNFTINGYGIGFLTISFLVYCLFFVLLTFWIIVERKKYLYKKIKLSIKKENSNKQKSTK